MGSIWNRFQSFWGTFWGFVVALAVVGGMVLAAIAIHALWAFFVVLGIAAVLTIGVKTAPLIRKFHGQIRDYPNLSAEVYSLREEIRIMRLQATEERRRAVLEGQRQILGAIMSHSTKTPILVGVTKRNDQLLLAATPSGSPPAASARYFVRTKLLGETKGIVQVQSYDGTRNLVFLELIESRVQQFWQHLEASAILDSALPDDIELTPYMFTMPPDASANIRSIIEDGNDRNLG